MCELLVAREVDRLFRYPRGRTLKLARAGKIPHVTLPDGEIRFREEDIQRLINGPSEAAAARAEQEVQHAG